MGIELPYVLLIHDFCLSKFDNLLRTNAFTFSLLPYMLYSFAAIKYICFLCVIFSVTFVHFSMFFCATFQFFAV